MQTSSTSVRALSSARLSTRPGSVRGLAPLWRQTLAGLRVLLVLTLVLGVGYPLLMVGVGQTAFGWRANGSLVRADGSHAISPGPDVVGSALVGQAVPGPDADGRDPWFHNRPSAANYDSLASGASNLGPNDQGLVETVESRRAAIAEREQVDPAQVPADALTASASGLDPDISPAYAAIQVPRVAAASGLTPELVAAIVARHTAGRDLGVLGEPRVNVLAVNSELASKIASESAKMSP